MDAARAKVCWDPQQCPHVIPLVTAPQVLEIIAAVRPPVTSTTVAGLDGRHVLISDGTRHLQLLIRAAAGLDNNRLLTEALVNPEYLAPRMTSLMCFNDLMSSGRLNPRFFPPEPRGRRLSLSLRALDGLLQGARHRDIASALYGRSRVDADWTDPRQHLRDATRRAVARGRALMSGGYLELLR